jgi:hypothetical protein
LRSSADGTGAGASSGAPHARQNFATSGFSCPQAEQTFMGLKSYVADELLQHFRSCQIERGEREADLAETLAALKAEQESAAKLRQ